MVARTGTTFCALVVLCAAYGCSRAEPQHAAGEQWIQLFNGRDLTGWTPKLTHHELGDNFGETFRVEDGLLKVRYDRYSDGFNRQFGHLFYAQPYSYYRLAIEYRFVGEQAAQAPGGWAKRNSGIMFHAQPPATMTKDQEFPISIEAQLLGGLDNGKARPTANMCSPGTEVDYQGAQYPEHCLDSQSGTYDGDQWVRMEILVLGNGQITHFVQGEKVLEYSRPRIGGDMAKDADPAVKRDGEPLSGGYIALQSESHPLDVRKIELLDLTGCVDPKARNYRQYFVQSDPKGCKY
ncbi:MAG TPA: DUF1080 domain-containing protein [Steroidobacteraceae bacterium]|nr:DUF1080 domain-containing protein [Steroidobacteraceae bacterium]